MDSVNLNCPCRCGHVSTGRRDPVHLHKLMKKSKTDLLSIGGIIKIIDIWGGPRLGCGMNATPKPGGYSQHRVRPVSNPVLISMGGTTVPESAGL